MSKPPHCPDSGGPTRTVRGFRHMSLFGWTWKVHILYVVTGQIPLLTNSRLGSISKRTIKTMVLCVWFAQLVFSISCVCDGNDCPEPVFASKCFRHTTNECWVLSSFPKWFQRNGICKRSNECCEFCNTCFKRPPSPLCKRR